MGFNSGFKGLNMEHPWNCYNQLYWKEIITPSFSFVCFNVSTVPSGLGLLTVEVPRLHPELDTTHSAGIVWTSDQRDAATSTFQHTTLTRHKFP